MDKAKIVWLVCANVQPPEIDTHLRHQKFAKYLANDGYEVYIIGGSYLHYNHYNLIDDKSSFIKKTYPGLCYYFIRVNSYKENVGLRRILSNFEFAWNLYKASNNLPRPDIIVHNTRIPFDFPIYWIAKKYKAKYITETWDLWPDDFVDSGLIGRNNPLLWLALLIAKFHYKKSKQIIFTVEGGQQYIKDHKWDKENGGPININNIHYINNGLDLEEFETNKQKYKFYDEDLEDTNKINIIYLGSISLINQVDLIIEVAKLMRDYKDIQFLIFGNGTERKKLIEKVKNEHIDNVKFKDEWVEIKYVPYIVSHADINLLNYAQGYKFKYGGSQGKLFQYLAAGRPIICNNILGYDIVNKYSAGISRNIENSAQYKDTILSILNDKTKYQQMCKASLTAANYFDFKNLYKEFRVVIENAINAQE